MNKNNDQYLEELTSIRTLMEQSAKFLSLSGLSGVFAGTFALIGAAAAYYFLDYGNVYYDEMMRSLSENSTSSVRLFLLIDASIVLFLSVFVAFLLSRRKARRLNQRIWNKASKRLLVHLAIPLLAGGAFSLLLIWHHGFALVASSTLVFYGLALFMAGNYTHREVRYLGIAEILLGLAAGAFLRHGLFFWTLGFGVLHIVYGFLMYNRHDKVLREEKS